MVSYHADSERDGNHDAFIARLNRPPRRRIFESYARDLEQACARCRAGDLAPRELLRLVGHVAAHLEHYGPGGALERHLRQYEPIIDALHRPAEPSDEAIDGAIDALIATDLRDEANGAAGAEEPDSAPPNSDPGTGLATSNTNSRCECRSEIED